jgi:chemotaxis protein CheZ
MPDAPAVAAVEDPRMAAAMRAVLGRMAGALSATEATLLAELEALGRTVERAKQEIAALKVDDITVSYIPAATGELDAIVGHTASATHEILDCCEQLEALEAELPSAARERLQATITRIYEACSFQDITGQRIGKVVTALKAIEARVAEVCARFAPRAAVAHRLPLPRSPARTEGQRLANGPQLPGAGVSQQEIDRLLASFD